VRAAVRAEWTKLRTVPGPAGLLIAAVLLTVALSALTAASTTCTACDPTRSSLSGIQLGQAVVAVLAVLVVGDEYGSGLIRTSLLAVPRRGVLLAAKVAVLVGPVLVAGAVGVAGSLAVGRAALPLSLGAGPTLRAAGGSVLYLVLVALLSLGVAVAVRDSAAAVGVVLGLLYLFPIVGALVTNPYWHRKVQQASPSGAGLAIQATIGLRDLPIGPWAGLGVLGLWAAGALLLGGVLLHLRDA
jgi:ABC-2 type transport system permease protein